MQLDLDHHNSYILFRRFFFLERNSRGKPLLVIYWKQRTKADNRVYSERLMLAYIG
jgi:hypothetical protein